MHRGGFFCLTQVMLSHLASIAKDTQIAALNITKDIRASTCITKDIRASTRIAKTAAIILFDGPEYLLAGALGCPALHHTA